MKFIKKLRNSINKRIFKLRKMFEPKINSNKSFKRKKSHPKNVKKVLAHVYGTSNLLNAVGAVKTLYGDNVKLDIITSPLSFGNYEAIFSISKNIEIISSVKVFSFDEIAKIEKVSEDFNKAKLLITEKLNENYDVIVYSHTCLHFFINIIKNIFPHAQTISYGDTWGGYANSDIYRKELNIDIMPPIEYRDKKEDIFCNLFAYDWYGINPDCNLRVVDTETMKSTFKEIDSDRKISSYCNKLLNMHPDKKKYLYMTENLYEAGFLSFENEVKMHIEIIEKYIQKGNVVVIKSHPHETYSRIDMLKKHFKNDYIFIGFQKRYNFYPIEIFGDLIKNAELNICCGCPLFTFKYLYGIKVVNPLAGSEGLVDRFFVDEYFKITEETNNKLEKLAGTLDTWDKKSMINLHDTKRKKA